MTDIACEVCQRLMPFLELKSIALIYARPGGECQMFQCSSHQHYGCCHEHAMIAALICLFEHIDSGPHSEVGVELSNPLLLMIRQLLQAYIKSEMQPLWEQEAYGTISSSSGVLPEPDQTA